MIRFVVTSSLRDAEKTRKENMMIHLIGICIMILIVTTLGCFVDKFLGWIVKKPELMSEFKKDDWEKIVSPSYAGDWIGFFERLIFLASFWMGVHTIIGGWFAFKVAAKWEVWKNIVQVPNTLAYKKITPLRWFQFRRAFGAYILSRFLIGTLVNVLIALVVSYVGKNLIDWADKRFFQVTF